MKHAREDYNRIQDPAYLIPENEPVFLIRGQDPAAPAAVEAYALFAELTGAEQRLIDLVRELAVDMRQWQEIILKRFTPLIYSLLFQLFEVGSMCLYTRMGSSYP